MGGRKIPRNPPGTRNIRDKSVISRQSRERRLGPPETVYVKGLYKLTLTAAVMSYILIKHRYYLIFQDMSR